VETRVSSEARTDGRRVVVTIEENPVILVYTRIRKSPYFYASRQHGVRR